MKKNAITLLALFMSSLAWAQDPNKIEPSGDVGIGTDTPQAKLHVETSAGSTSEWIRLTQGVTDYRISHDYGRLKISEGLTDRLVIRSGGNVGIGTASPVDLLHLSQANADATLHLTNDNSGHTMSDGAEFNLQLSTSNIVINNRESAGIDFRTSALQRMLIDAAGNVGIGTATPSAQLDIASNNKALKIGSTGNGEGFYLQHPFSDATGFKRFVIGGNLWWDNNRWNFGNPGSNAFSAIMARGNSGLGLYTKPNTGNVAGSITEAELEGQFLKMVVRENGNVGIGTQNPDAKLHVSGSNVGLGNSLASVMIGKDNGPEISAIQDSGDDDVQSLAFRVKSSSINADPNFEAMRIRFDGNVGIGTQNPDAKLHVSGSNVGLGNSLASIMIGKDNGPEIAAIQDSGDDDVQSLAFRVKSSSINADPNFEAMRIRFDGNVGMGTLDPSAKLTVKGDILAEKVKVVTNVEAVPDYVFNEGYELRSLEEVASFVKANSHLPEVPSAKEIAADGHDLAAMNLLLLKKVEELTLYAIDQNQKLKDQELENLRFWSEYSALKEGYNQLLERVEKLEER